MAHFPSAVSVVMRSYNEAWALEGTLKSLFAQDFDGGIELIVIDSGSTDESIDIFKRYNPTVLREILPSEYVPGVVLNWGIEQASNDWVICLNADATPSNDQWLKELLKVGLESEKPRHIF